MTTLREVTADHIQDAMDGLEGTVRRQRATALRSLFRARKRERLVFRDLVCHLPVGDLTGIPRPVPSDVLAGLLDQAATPFARLAIALAAIHAVPAAEIPTALTADLNLARGTLELRCGLRRRALYLEELTHHLAGDWLTYRHRRRPTSSNPHLLVSQKTAPDPDYPAVHRITKQKGLPKRADPRQAAPGSDPRRSVHHWRPAHTHEALRHHRGDRHALRRHRLPGANREAAQVAAR